MQQSLIASIHQTDSYPASSYSAVEKLIDRVNGQGKFQLISFFILSLQWFLTSWLLLGMSFFFDNTFTCKNPQYTTMDSCRDYICSISPSLRAAQIDSHSSSIAFQFDGYMICSQFENTIPILQSMLFFGSLTGFFIIPNIADNSGRKVAIKVAWIIATVSVLIVTMADSPRIIGLGLFFIGFGANPAITLAFSFINQQCVGKYRQQFGVGVQISLALGETTIALIFLSQLSWRQIMMILLVLFVLVYIPLQLFLKQTPMYMIQKSPHLTLKLLNEIAIINQRDIISQEQFTLIMPKNVQLQQDSKVGILDLFRYDSLRWISISTGFIFFGIQTIYYSTTLNLGDVGFSKTVNQIIFGISEMMGYIAAEFIIHKSLRKKSTFIGLGTASFMCLILGILILLKNSTNETTIIWLQAIGLMINRFVLCGFWSIFYVYVAELYPTQIRSLGYGWTSVMGMIGSTISPFVTTISANIGINNWFPPAIIGFISCIFIVKLPETLKNPLKDIIEEHANQKNPQNQDVQTNQTEIK